MVNSEPSSSEEYNPLHKLADMLGLHSVTQRAKTFGSVNALLASNSIRITGVSLASSDENGVSGLITYEYKWVPSDTEKAAPRWDTGVINFLGDTDEVLFNTYLEMYETVQVTREELKKIKEQVKTF